MARPPTSILAEQTYRELLPLAQEDEARGWPLLYFIESISSTAREIEDLVRDTDDYPGWSAAVDIDRAPERLLDWLAQFIGVGKNKGLSPALYRQRIRDAEGMKRGTLASIENAARTHLTGDAPRVTVRERDGSAYKLTLITYTSETPDSAAVLASVLRVKPAGLVLTYTVYDGWIYSENRDFYAGQTYADMGGDFTTYSALRERLP